MIGLTKACQYAPAEAYHEQISNKGHDLCSDMGPSHTADNVATEDRVALTLIR